MRLVTLLAFLAGTFLGGCKPAMVEHPPEGQCINRSVREFASPDGKYKAVRFDRLCSEGLPTSNVSVLAASAMLADAPGNAFVNIPPTHGKGHSERILLAWQAPHRLRIVRNPEMHVQLDAAQVGEVSIEHSTDFAK